MKSKEEFNSTDFYRKNKEEIINRIKRYEEKMKKIDIKVNRLFSIYPELGYARTNLDKYLNEFKDDYVTRHGYQAYFNFVYGIEMRYERDFTNAYITEYGIEPVIEKQLANNELVLSPINHDCYNSEKIRAMLAEPYGDCDFFLDYISDMHFYRNLLKDGKNDLSWEDEIKEANNSYELYKNKCCHREKLENEHIFYSEKEDRALKAYYADRHNHEIIWYDSLYQQDYNSYKKEKETLNEKCMNTYISNKSRLYLHPEDLVSLLHINNKYRYLS